MQRVEMNRKQKNLSDKSKPYGAELGKNVRDSSTELSVDILRLEPRTPLDPVCGITPDHKTKHLLHVTFDHSS